MRRRTSLGLAVVLGLLSLTAPDCLAQAFIERVEPPVVVRGEVTRVTLIGSSLQHATGLWVSTPGGRVTGKLIGSSRPDTAVFDVTVAAEVPLGIFGLRLATQSGLSNAHLFLVGEHAAVPEEEMQLPRGTPPGTATQVVPLPVVISGTCRPEDVDTFAFDVSAGQEVSFEVVGSRLGKGIDPLITIRDAAGSVIIQKDNDVGLFFDCRFAHRFARAGRYTVEVRDSRFRGSEHWGWILRMGRFPAARVALPAVVPPRTATRVSFPQLAGVVVELTPAEPTAGWVTYVLKRPGDQLSAWLPLRISPLAGTLEHEPNDNPDQATTATVPGLLHGVLGKPGDRDRFRIELKQGRAYQLRAETRAIGSPADLELVLVDAKGTEVARADDSGFDDALLSFTPKADGVYSLLVQEVVNWGGPEFVYAITVEPRPPRLGLASGVTRIALPQGTRQPLPLSLSRTGVSGPVVISLIGGPKGVTLKTVEVADGVGEVDNYLLCDPATPAGLYTLQIEARVKGKPGSTAVTALAATRPLVDRVSNGRGPHGEPFELREDQRRLPPSLTERIALVVLPGSPFDFEIEQPLVRLARYQSCRFSIRTTRVAGFDSPIRFVARGGELEQDQLRKPRVRSQIPDATTENPVVDGVFTSYVNSKVLRQRVTLTGTAVFDGRQLSLTRTFDLEVVVAFRPGSEPRSVTLKPGDTRMVKFKPNRVAPFDGPVMLSIGRVPGLELPGTVIVPAGKEFVELAVKADGNIKPGKYSVSLSGLARVERFQESNGGAALEVVVEKK